MGVDVTLFVLATYGPYVDFSFRLSRDYATFEMLETAQRSGRVYPEVKLPNSSWCHFSGQMEPLSRDRECGWIHETAYGESLVAIKGASLPVLDGSDLNASVFRLIRECLANHDVILFWH